MANFTGWLLEVDEGQDAALVGLIAQPQHRVIIYCDKAKGRNGNFGNSERVLAISMIRVQKQLWVKQ